MAKATDTISEAEALIPTGKTRLGAVNRLYYACHHIAVALLRLVGNSASTHEKIKNQFSLEWVKKRRFPRRYGKLLNHLFDERKKADYGEFVRTFSHDLLKKRRLVHEFLKRAWREIPRVSTQNILEILKHENPEIRDYSFDVYCPNSYLHHTRLSIWVPCSRVTDEWIEKVVRESQKLLNSVGVEDYLDYVVGINSRVNQYDEHHLLMLDFDDVSSLPFEKLAGEPGFFFRTESGFHFIGARLYPLPTWKRKMTKYSKLASHQHHEFSMKRGYGTLRLTTSKRKPFKPAYIGRTKP